MGDDDRSAAELDDELQYLHDLEQRNVQLLPTPQAMSAELTAERNKMVKVMHAQTHANTDTHETRDTHEEVLIQVLHKSYTDTTYLLIHAKNSMPEAG